MLCDKKSGNSSLLWCDQARTWLNCILQPDNSGEKAGDTDSVCDSSSLTSRQTRPLQHGRTHLISHRLVPHHGETLRQAARGVEDRLPRGCLQAFSHHLTHQAIHYIRSGGCWGQWHA